MQRMAIVFVALFLCIAVAPSFAQTVQHGEFKLTIESEGWTLHQGEGTRTFQYIVTFDRPYESAPTMTYGVTGLDAGIEKNIRYTVKVEKVTITGFVIRITTWADSRIYGIYGNWLAFGK